MNVTCPATCAGVPSETKCSSLVTKKNIASASTSSGTTSGTVDKNVAGLALAPRQRLRKIDSDTPSGTVMTIASAASTRLWTIAELYIGSLKTEFGPVHHCSEKPCQMLRDNPLLNENRNAIRTGASDQTRYTTTTVTSPMVGHGRRCRRPKRPSDCARDAGAPRGATWVALTERPLVWHGPSSANTGATGSRETPSATRRSLPPAPARSHSARTC